MNNTLVSAVITTCCRKVKYLQRAVESVLNQDYPNIELIIIDDSPNDYEFRSEVKKYCESLKNKDVHYYQNEIPLGACASRNRGLELSIGEYIGFLDDDDEWLENKITILMKEFERNSEIAMVYGDFWLINEETGRRTKYSDSSKPYFGNVYNEMLLSNFIGSTSVPLLNKKAMLKVGKFDDEQPAMQDWDTWIRIAEKYRIGYVSECIINYYIHSGEHISKVPCKRINGLLRLNEKQKKYLDANLTLKISRYYYLMRLHIANKEVKKAFDYYKTIVKCQPKKVIDNVKMLKAFGRLIIKSSNGWS